MNPYSTSTSSRHIPVTIIGDIQLANPTILAPMAGITNLPFRLMVKQTGCALVYSEMISSHGLVYRSPKTYRLLDSRTEESPLAVQIFGADPSIMAEAAAIVEGHGAQILDINLGCSVKKIIKTGAGAALMKTPDIAAAVMSAVRRAIRIPMTIKIRSGWEASGRQAVDMARLAEDCGVDAVAVHPRTATQAFGGEARWPVIAAVKNAVSIPVIGNGDIRTAIDALDMFAQTGCDAVMVGRAAMDNPLIFSQILSALHHWPMPEYHLAARFSLMRQYLDNSVAYLGERHACRMMRSRLGWFVKGLPQSSQFRQAIKQITAQSDAHRLLADYQAALVRLDSPCGAGAAHSGRTRSPT